MKGTRPDFDLTYRPDYWAPSDPISVIIANVKGEERRRRILDVLQGRHQIVPPGVELPEEMLADSLSAGDRIAWGKLHPSHVGGESLPDYSRGEIEIARIVVATDCTEVVSIRARRSRDLRIHYAVVDEYETRFTHHPHSSQAPLTLAEMISLVDSIRQENREIGREYVTWCRACCYKRYSGHPERCSHFVKVESAFYPRLEAFYHLRNDQWLANELCAVAAKGGASQQPGNSSAGGEEAAR